MVIGERVSKDGTDYMLASESVALEHLGYMNIRDIKPGEAVIIKKGNKPIYSQVHKQLEYAPDMFEYVYFARPDSVIDGISVDMSRQAMGHKLALKIRKQLTKQRLDEIDVVIPIPETSMTSAIQVAADLEKPYRLGFVKNRYIFRTFIMSSKDKRIQGVRRKLSANRSYFENRNVLLIDDSIVRGTTSHEIVQIAKEAGAKKVIFASCAPPITHQHIYGIDLASSSELIAHHRDQKQIAEIIGADAVVYQDLPDLVAACSDLSSSPKIKNFEVGVFCGKYVTPVDDKYFEHLERVRGKVSKAKKLESAREAVVNGLAGEEEIRMAAQSARTRETEEDDAELADGKLNGHAGVNGTSSPRAKRKREDEDENGGTVRYQSQDISLYNLNDHES